MALAFSPDPDILANFSLENYYRGSTSQLMSNIDDELRYSIGGRWRSLSEEYDHPFTLTFGATVGRDFNKPSVGALFTDVVLSKRLSRLDLKLSALYGIYASEKPLGVGLGVSREVLPSFYIGGEIFAALAFPLARTNRVSLLLVFIGASAFGGLIERIQPTFNRSADLNDWIADILGVMLGIALGLIYRRVRKH